MDMQQPIHQKCQIEGAIAAAEKGARRIGRTLRLPPSDIPDARQDLLVDLLRRARRYDGRAPWPVFANVILRHAAHDLTGRLIRERDHRGGSLDDGIRIGDRIVPRHEVVVEEAGIAAWWSGPSNGVAAIDLRIDVGRFVGELPTPLARLCRLLMDDDQPQAASGLSRSEYFRQVRELRMRLLALGLTTTPLGTA